MHRSYTGREDTSTSLQVIVTAGLHSSQATFSYIVRSNFKADPGKLAYIIIIMWLLAFEL